ncbi:GNAT family N-acetyltransferase [Kiloniella antarctica]|uniref:GNAT family N-acetyltransferase n=1 Tax=Kiloniella antarctica TaxID=1550907 RepID=A0ABW5BI35_9PROT
MDEIVFVHLYEVHEQELIDLMNNEMVGKQMPLLSGGFSSENCQNFLKAKKKIWDEHGYGPWAFLIKGEFAGWGGLQPEHGDADFALVLHPKFWGWGRKIFEKVIARAFNEMKLNSITVLFPPSRTNSKAIKRMGFVEDGELNVDGALFMRFRLTKASHKDSYSNLV